MKKILLLMFLMLFTSRAYADLVVIYNEGTKELYTVSDKDGTQVPEGCKKIVLEGKSITNVNFPANPTDCIFRNNAFIKNTAKIEREKQEELERDQAGEATKAKVKDILTEEEIQLLFE